MTDYDVIIIGAGAAGLMAGIAAGEAGARVLMLDGATKLGAKILVAGGGRCNVTNERVEPRCFNGEGAAPFVTRVLRSFSTADTHRFFAARGVPLKLEPEMGKYFPVSDSGRTVLNMLLSGVERAGCTLLTGHRVVGLARHEEGWKVRATLGADGNGIQDERAFDAPAVVLCSGGKALPKSGSDGAGYGFALQHGHTLVKTTPALSPLLCDQPVHSPLSGVTLPIQLTLYPDASPKAAPLTTFRGSFLFTHVGYSGPAALNISRSVAREVWRHPRCQVRMAVLDAEESPNTWWHNFVRLHAKKTLFNALNTLLPTRVAEMVIGYAGIPTTQTVGKISPALAQRVQEALFALPLPITRVADYVKAEATAGGIALAEIEPATMMSRLAPGLFLAGEVCDIDGWLGGYNFQWAWSSGVVAGRGAARYVRKQSAVAV